MTELTEEEARLKSSETELELVVETVVQTPYGEGTVVDFRADDGMYAISISLQPPQESSSKMMLYTPTLYSQTKQEEDSNTKTSSSSSSMELNIAYTSLEKMRRLNLQMQAHEELGIELQESDYDKCTVCLLSQQNQQKKERFPILQKFADETLSKNPSSFPRIRKFWSSAETSSSEENKSEEPSSTEPSETKKKIVVLPRIQKLLDERSMNSKATPCLICAAPTCSQHASKSFAKQASHITLCCACERLFELDFIVECVSTGSIAERSQHVQHMMDMYDRSLLLLKYSAQFIESIARVLEEKQEQSNKIGLGSSSVGMVSGVLGVAAAATILTPAGPPLLVASLLFGGGATAVQTGSEAMNYFSEPKQLADRIIALHGMCHSILRVTSTLRDAMLRDHIRIIDTVETTTTESLSEQAQQALEQNRSKVLLASNAGRGMALSGVASAEAGAVAARAAATEASAVAASSSAAVASAEAGVVGARTGATAMSRAGTAAARTLRVARFAGGALSAAIIMMEANAMKSTLASIQAGNPCETADALRDILHDLSELPSSDDLDRECQAYLTALASREQARTTTASTSISTSTAVEQEVQAEEDIEVDMQIPQATCQAPPPPTQEQHFDDLVIVEGEDDDSIPQATPAATPPQAQSLSGSSLLERIQLHKSAQLS